MKILYCILNLISKLCSYSLIFTLLFLIQKIALGLFFEVKTIVVFNTFYLYEIVFTITTIVIIKKYIQIYSPYEKYLSKC